MNHKIIIIGGGASALMLASLLPKNSAVMIDANPKPGAKVLISGGGKCNITNIEMGSDYFVGDQAFTKPALRAFDEKSLLLWLRQRRLVPVLRNGQHYFCKESAKEILALFAKETQFQKKLLNEKVLSVMKHGEYFSVKTDKRTLTAKYVVVASGGLSFPKIGASGIGYEIAEHFGHSIEKTAPGLVGLTVQKEQFFFKELSGLSTEVEMKVGENSARGALLFAHKGISGPAVLDASLYWEKGKIEVNFLPGFSLQSLKQSKKQLTSLLPMPKRLTKAFLIQLNLKDKTGTKLTSEDLQKLKSLQRYSFSPAGTFGYSKAEVTKGGVSTREIDAETMMSKRAKGLYFLGEVLDVTGRLGGYNFQWAFSSAYLCAQDLNKELR